MHQIPMLTDNYGTKRVKSVALRCEQQEEAEAGRHSAARDGGAGRHAVQQVPQVLCARGPRCRGQCKCTRSYIQSNFISIYAKMRLNKVRLQKK